MGMQLPCCQDRVSRETPGGAASRGGECFRLRFRLSMLLRSWLHVNPGYRELMAARGLRTPQDLLAEAGSGKQVSWGSRVAAWRTLWEDAAGEPLPVYVKIYYLDNYPFRYFGRLGRAAWEGINYARLEQAGIPVPEVIACAEIRRFGTPIRGIVVTREIPAVKPLDQFLAASGSGSAELRRNLLAKLAVLVGKAHKALLIHRDLKARNVLVGGTADSAAADPEVFWIDCPRGVRLPFRARPGFIKDLADLCRTLFAHSTEDEMDGFFSVYAAESGIPERKQWIVRRVEKRLGKKGVYPHLPPSYFDGSAASPCRRHRAPPRAGSAAAI